ncbi:unnamed protein product [Candidula unifasciata]|uniref:Uncharacterized protein n=1 Tax=Candidula unifasciata TaxID=100452 RepID=A0A8S3Z7H5_9EUPU|nr:unnamed protein product [Candidula unifasciata]
MCVSASIWTMGCGKSRHHSPDVSEIDLRNSGSLKNSSGGVGGHKVAGKRSKTKSGRHDSNGLDNDTGDRPSSAKKTSNGKTRSKDKNKDPGNSLGISSQSSSSSSSGNRAAASSSAGALGDKANGATKPQGSYYLLEVPHDVYKADSSSKVTNKDVKSSTSTRTVHVTTSQLEFFKMLDEKIEMGGDYQASNEASEVSSADDAVRQ